jgi:hypothetical protein
MLYIDGKVFANCIQLTHYEYCTTLPEVDGISTRQINRFCVCFVRWRDQVLTINIVTIITHHVWIVHYECWVLCFWSNEGYMICSILIYFTSCQLDSGAI